MIQSKNIKIIWNVELNGVRSIIKTKKIRLMKRFFLVILADCFVAAFAQQEKIVPKTINEPTAEELYHKAFDYLEGKNGLPVDTTKAIETWKIAAEKGHVDAQVMLAIYYSLGKGMYRDEEKAVYWYSKAANQGDAAAQYQLGVRYETGKGIIKDNKQAVYWYRLAAEQGHDIAQTTLGDFYFDGFGVEKNYEQAKKWYLKASEQNNARSFLGLFRIHLNGNGVDRNVKEAVKYLTKGAELGDVACQWLLGFNYYTDVNGLGLSENGELATYWLEKAVVQNHDGAMEVLADMYAEGKLVKRDKQKANELYRRAAELGNSEAAYKLASAYGFGDGVDVDKGVAFKWMKKSAELGYAKAQLNLGYFFATGYACEKDETAAKYWWRMVVNNINASEDDKMGAQKNIDMLDE